MPRPLKLLLVLIPTLLSAQVVFNNTNTMGFSNTMSYSGTMTVTAGHQNLVAVACIMYGASQTGYSISSVTYGGQAMTSAGANSTGATWVHNQAFYLVNPPTGSNTLSVTATGSGGTFYELHVGLSSFYGANQTTPVRAGTYQRSGASFSAPQPSLTITSSTSPGDLTYTCAGSDVNLTSKSNQTQDGQNGSGNWWGAHDHATTAASSVTHTWATGTATYSSIVGFSIMAEPPHPTLSFSGCPSSGSLRVDSTTCTVNLADATFDGGHSVTLSDGGNLGTFTSGGNSGNPLTITPASGTSFTFTYNPFLVGTKLLSITNPSSWVNPSAQSYVVTRSDGCSFVAAANGNANSSGTWAAGCGSHSTPDTGDSISITGFDVTIPAGVTLYAGSCPANNTTYDLTIAPTAYNGTTGRLLNQGTFWFCGNAKLNAPAHASPTAFAKLQFDTGSAFKWDLNSGSVAYRIVPGSTGGWNNLIVGTTGDACLFGATYSCPTTITPVNIGTANPLLLDSNSTTDNVTFQIFGARISNCGSASKGCIEHNSAGVSNGYASAGLIDVRDTALDATGTIQSPAGFQSVTTINLLRNRFLNDLAGVFTLNAAPTAFLGGACVYDGNLFSGALGTEAHKEFWPGCAVKNNAFLAALYANFTSARPPGPWANNLVVLSSDIDTYNIGVGNSPAIRNTYFLGYQTSASGFHTNNFDQAADSVATGNVYEQMATDWGGGSGHLWADVGCHPSNTRTGTFNLSLASSSGKTAGTGNIGCVAASTASTLAVMEHNTWIGAANYGYGSFSGHPGSPAIYATNQFGQSYRSNLHYATSGTTNFGLGDALGNPALAPANEWVVGNITNNGYFGASTSSTFGVGVSTNCSPSSSLGTHYNLCTTGATPGANDIDADPRFLDKTRNAAQWATRVRGQAATIQGIFAAFQQCPDIGNCVAHLLSWVRTGYQPMNLSFKGKAHDGADIGAVPIVHLPGVM